MIALEPTLNTESTITFEPVSFIEDQHEIEYWAPTPNDDEDFLEFPLLGKVEYKIRPYQQGGIDFLRVKQRAIITDEPGLGKTLQATEAAKDFRSILVSCPTYLMDQWFDWIHEQYPNDSIALASGTRSQRERALSIPAKWKIVNHEMFRSYLPSIPHVDCLIIDEMHHVRNKDAKQSKYIFLYANPNSHATTQTTHQLNTLPIPNIYGLTATPVVKEPDDFFMQLRILDPLTFSSYNQFVYDYCLFTDSMYGMQIIGLRNKNKFKREVLDNYVIGRSYEDVGIQLPALVQSFRRVRLTDDNRTMYDRIRDYYHYAFEDPDGSGDTINFNFDNALSVMHALRTITSCAVEKRDLTALLAEDLPNYALFTWYKPAAAYLAEKLGATLLNGDVPVNERTAQARSSTKIVATISSLSEGVDLSHIRNCIFFEEWYTYGVMHQTLSRLRRFRPDGSEEPVNVYYCHADKTIDQGIHEVSRRRTATANDIKGMIKKELAR